MNQSCKRMSVALRRRWTVTPLSSTSVGPGLELFQPGVAPTASPFNRIVTLLLVMERRVVESGDRADLSMTTVVPMIRATNKMM